MIENKVCYFNNGIDKVEVIDNNVYINEQISNCIGEGVDGRVYKYGDSAIKLYHDDNYVKEHLTKEQIIILSSFNIERIILPKEVLQSSNNDGFIMEYIDLSNVKDILLVEKNILLKEIKEIEKDLFFIGKNSFLLNDKLTNNLYFCNKLYLVDTDSFLYDSKCDFSDNNLEIFAWFFIRDILCGINKNVSKKEELAFVRKLYYLYKKGNYLLLSNFLADIINGNNLMSLDTCYINNSLANVKKRALK